MKLDQIGFWSEIKLEIIKEYANSAIKNERCRNILAGRHNGKTEGSFEKEI